MNQQPELKFTDLTARYLLAKQAEGKSPATIKGYGDILKPFTGYLEDQGLDVLSINRDVADGYFVYLRQRPKFPNRPAASGNGSKLAEESVRDHLRALKACFSWLVEEGYLAENAFRRIKLSKSPAPIIQPLSDDEVITVQDSIDQKAPAGKRNHAIFGLLIDGGFRASDLANAILAGFDRIKGTLTVKGKGQKERTVPLGENAHAELLIYVNDVRPIIVPNPEHLFLTTDGKPVSVNAIKLMFFRLARKSGVTRLHAHLCRHTFATDYLLNGGDIFSLQIILGHSSLEMVKRYLHFTKAQIAAKHREFSPMDRILKKHREDNQQSD